MNGLQKTIISDLHQAIKENNVKKKNFLKVVVAEMSRGKFQEINDEQAIAILKKMKEDALTMHDDYEVEILNTYLPLNYTTEELLEIVKKIIAENNVTSLKQRGLVMGKIKMYNGTKIIDNRIVSEILAELLPQ